MQNIEQNTGFSDEELVGNAKNGDMAAFKLLVKRLEGQVAATVYSMLGRCPEAEDVGQETFIRLYKSLKSFRGESLIRSYVIRIAINLSLNEIKRRKRWYQIFDSPKETGQSDLPSKKNEAKDFENKDLINWGMRQIKAEYKAVLVLRILEGYSTAETAEILKVPTGTVSSRLARAQMKLKEIIAPQLGRQIGK